MSPEKKYKNTHKNTKSSVYRLTSVRGERAASPQLSPDPFLCPHSRSCRRATPEVPVPPSGWATRYCAPRILDFVGIAIIWERGGGPGVLQMFLEFAWQASPLWSPSFSLVPEHQVSLNDILILF